MQGQLSEGRDDLWFPVVGTQCCITPGHAVLNNSFGTPRAGQAGSGIVQLRLKPRVELPLYRQCVFTLGGELSCFDLILAPIKLLPNLEIAPRERT